MKCKFEHDGDCCNSGATQYMCKCKQPCDTIMPVSNADRIRAMTDEELAEFMFSMVDCVSCENKLMNNGELVFGEKRKTCTDKDYHAMCNGDGRKCEAVCLAWLKQPVKDGEDDGV